MIKRIGVFICVFCLVVSCSSICFASSDTEVYEVFPDGRPVFLDSSGVSTFGLAPITGDNKSGMVKLVLDVIGDYDPIVAEYQYTGTNGYTQYVREIQPDYVWIASALIFLLVLYSVFRLWGAFLCKL